MLRDMGVEHVYDSRSVEFAEQIRARHRRYGGYRAELLTGAAQRGLEVVGLRRTLRRNGRADVYGNTSAGAVPVPSRLTFYHLTRADVGHPDSTVRELLATVMFKFLTADGVPTTAMNFIPVTEAADAIRPSNAEHTGKPVLDVPRRSQKRGGHPGVTTAATAPTITGGCLRPSACSSPSKLAAAGCGRIKATARSQPNPGARHHRRPARLGQTSWWEATSPNPTRRTGW